MKLNIILVVIGVTGLFMVTQIQAHYYQKTISELKIRTTELSQCNSEYQKLVDYHKTQGISNPFIECVSYPERDLCFEQTMTGCLGDIAPDTEGYNRQLVLCEFMSIAAWKLEYEKNYGAPERTDDHPDYFTRCTASKDYDQCVKEAAKQCMPDKSADKKSVKYRKAYDRCNRQFHNLQKDREVFLDIVELVQEDTDNTFKERE